MTRTVRLESRTIELAHQLAARLPRKPDTWPLVTLLAAVALELGPANKNQNFHLQGGHLYVTVVGDKNCLLLVLTVTEGSPTTLALEEPIDGQHPAELARVSFADRSYRLENGRTRADLPTAVHYLANRARRALG